MNRASFFAAGPGMLLLLLLGNSALAQEQFNRAHDGAAIVFERAQLLKPRENTNIALSFMLAPLILQEVCDTNSPVVPACIFFQPGVLRINGQDYAQMTYWWTYDRGNSTRAFGLRWQAQREPVFKGGSAELIKTTTRSVDAHQANPTCLSAQGIRLTLGTNGVPVIYEVLGHADNPAQIFVTQSVEAAARASFGSPLPGRRFAVERSLKEAPAIIVPRVIDDPPVMMGPILFLRARTHEMATLICRCMPSEARELAGSACYTLVPSNAPPSFWIPARPLAEALRFPARDGLEMNSAH